MRQACIFCGGPIVGRAPQAKFCCHGHAIANSRETAKMKRLDRKAAMNRHCAVCRAAVPLTRRATSPYCSEPCRKSAERSRWREKIARYRAADPERYQAHRSRENGKRLRARAALNLIHEIEAKGLEALL